MSFEIPIDGIDRINAQFIESLTGREWVGVDKNGRLYAVQGFFQSAIYLVASRCFSSPIHARVLDSLNVFLKDKKAEWLEAPPENKKLFYDSLIRKLSRTNILSAENHLFLINDYYQDRYDELLHQGKSPLTAESIVSIEMCYDPSVPESVKAPLMPMLTSAGNNGTYIIKKPFIIKNRQGDNIGIFKPWDEQDDMPHNPRGNKAPYNSQNLLRRPYHGFVQGTGCQKEVAVSMIDCDRLFDVPETVSITVPFPKEQGSRDIVFKEGSLQQFISGTPLDQVDWEEIQKYPVREVQKIVLLDLLIGNGDRHFGNCFWNENMKKLIPIDNGCSFLDSADWRPDNDEPTSETNCHLALLPQLEQPVSEDLDKWMESLNIDDVAAELRGCHSLAETSLNELKIRWMVLQKALEKGLTLNKIVPMLMLIKGKPPLLEAWGKEAAEQAQLQQHEWESLPSKEIDIKRFNIYLKHLEQIVDKKLNEEVS